MKNKTIKKLVSRIRELESRIKRTEDYWYYYNRMYFWQRNETMDRDAFMWTYSLDKKYQKWRAQSSHHPKQPKRP